MFACSLGQDWAHHRKADADLPLFFRIVRGRKPVGIRNTTLNNHALELRCTVCAPHEDADFVCWRAVASKALYIVADCFSLISRRIECTTNYLTTGSYSLHYAPLGTVR